MTKTDSNGQQGELRPPAAAFRGPIRLASGSPRRVSLLAEAGFLVEQRVSGADETWPPGPVGPAAAAVARRKLEVVVAPLTAAAGRIATVAADTVVVLGDEILGKPRDTAHLRAMLGRQRGQQVRVVTGVAIAYGAARRRLSATTLITFRDFADQEADAYAQTGIGLDKSGGWGLQGVLGLVARATGSLSNVLGLPVAETLAALARLGRL